MTKKSEANLIPTQAVILAAGENSRFVPFQRERHKSTFSLFGEPIISQTVQVLVRAGIQEIEIIRSPKDRAIEQLLSLKQSTSSIRFSEQGKPLGMGNALIEVSKNLKDRFLVVNPQQINIDQHLLSLQEQSKKIELTKKGVVLFSQKTNEPQKYGILGLKGNQVTRVVEKPQDLKGLSNQRVLGIYILTRDFLEFMKTLKTSEYQLEVALDKYSRKQRIIAVQSDYPALSLKYAWDLFTIAHHRFMQFPNKPDINPQAEVDPSARISGPVIIEEGAHIYEYAIINGPCYIGKNAVVGSYCKVRKETVLEEGVELQNSVDVKHSIIGQGTHVHSGFIGDSIIGENVGIGANFATANRRLDRKKVRVLIKGQMVDTRTSFFGSLIGDKAKIGIHCGTNPGVIVPEDSVITPGTIVTN